MRASPVRIARLMVIVALLAIDFGALRATLPVIPNPGLALMVVILQVALVKPGSKAAFGWGFQLGGWVYVLGSFTFSRWAWAFARSLFEAHLLGAKISRPGDLNRFLLFAGGLHLMLALGIAFTVGLVTRWIVGAKRGEFREGQVGDL